MSPDRARFLTSLYPPAWRGRFGAEFRTFLESREVSLAEALNIAACALVARLKESWPVALMLSVLAAVFTFSAGTALFFWNGRARARRGVDRLGLGRGWPRESSACRRRCRPGRFLPSRGLNSTRW